MAPHCNNRTVLLCDTVKQISQGESAVIELTTDQPPFNCFENLYDKTCVVTWYMVHQTSRGESAARADEESQQPGLMRGVSSQGWMRGVSSQGWMRGVSSQHWRGESAARADQGSQDLGLMRGVSTQGWWGVSASRAGVGRQQPGLMRGVSSQGWGGESAARAEWGESAARAEWEESAARAEVGSQQPGLIGGVSRQGWGGESADRAEAGSQQTGLRQGVSNQGWWGESAARADEGSQQSVLTTAGNKSALDQVMAYCHQASSLILRDPIFTQIYAAIRHRYAAMSQCVNRPCPLLPHGIIKGQQLNLCISRHQKQLPKAFCMGTFRWWPCLWVQLTDCQNQA